MTAILAKHPPYDDGRLGEVGLDMDHAGTPTIRCIEIEGKLYAIEGSHRLAQAHERGLTPKVIILDPDLPGLPRVPDGLPEYNFDHVLALRERDFDE